MFYHLPYRLFPLNYRLPVSSYSVCFYTSAFPTTAQTSKRTFFLSHHPSLCAAVLTDVVFFAILPSDTKYTPHSCPSCRHFCLEVTTRYRLVKHCLSLVCKMISHLLKANCRSTLLLDILKGSKSSSLPFANTETSSGSQPSTVASVLSITRQVLAVW